MTYQEHKFARENVQRYIAQRRIVRLCFVDLGNVVKRDNRITRVLRSGLLNIHYRKRLRKLRRNLIYWGLLLVSGGVILPFWAGREKLRRKKTQQRGGAEQR